MEGFMKNCYRNNLIEFAMLQLDKKYVWGSQGPEEFDCSGLTYYLFKELFNIDINKNGIGLGDTTKQMTNNLGILKEYKEDDPNKKDYLKDINIGDLIFFHKQSMEENHPSPNNRYPGHVGIYLGNEKFIHASSNAGKVIISPLTDEWLKSLVASRDIINSIIKES